MPGGVTTPGFSQAALRCLVFAIAAVSIGWAIYAMPVFWRQSPLEKMALSIIAGDQFKPAAISGMRQTVDSMMAGPIERPAILASMAIFRLRVLELTITNGRQQDVDDQMETLQATIRQSLANAPSDAFLWLVLFWVENMRNGFSEENLKYLRMSYETGPNEGWVALRRNRFSLALFNELPDDLAKQAVGEFAGLVNSNFSNDAADILISSGWKVRDRLMPALASADRGSRIDFAKVVFRLGYDITVPGVDPPDQRPWQ